MKGYSMADLLAAGVGEWYCGDLEFRVEAAVIDSRQGSLEYAFIARRGESRDGHDYLDDAISRGSRVLLLERAWAEEHSSYLEGVRQQGLTVLLTANGEDALLTWAAWQRQRLTKTTVLAITGSYAKTTTKELIFCCLKPYFQVDCAPGNWNSLTGVALSLLRVAPTSQVAIFECGIDHCGEMQTIADLLRPAQVLITAIGSAHLQSLRNQETVAFEKSRLFKGSDVRVVFLPCEDAWYDYLSQEANYLRRVDFGPQSLDSYADQGLAGGQLSLGTAQITLPLLAYKVRALQAAVTVGRYWQLSEQQIVDGLSTFIVPEGRGNFQQTDYHVLQDSYNAPRESVTGLLHWLASRRHDGRIYRIVLADMLELGAESRTAHQQIGQVCPLADNFFYFFLGNEMHDAYCEYCRRSPTGAYWSDGHQPLAERLRAELQRGDVLILKGSRGMQLEKILQYMEDEESAC